jgi:hypothetical protein
MEVAMRKLKYIALLSLTAMIFVSPAFAHEAEAEEESHGILHKTLMYIPNRLLDVLDIVRARVRVGPGVSVCARATEVLDVNIGAHNAVYVGLPGPRGEAKLPLVVGTEAYSGIGIGDEKDIEGAKGPEYAFTEIGVGAQAVLAGVDVGIDPLEVLDFVTGLFFIDLTGDDL